MNRKAFAEQTAALCEMLDKMEAKLQQGRRAIDMKVAFRMQQKIIQIAKKMIQIIVSM